MTKEEQVVEDAKMFTDVDKITDDQGKREFPVQTLQGGGKPTDVTEQPDWKLDGDSWVDVYEGPLGIGYVVNTEIDKGGVKYRRAIGFGPEKRDQDWTEVRSLEEKDAGRID